MAGILRPFGNIAAPGPFQVPSGPGQYTIDWTNRLATNLIACWLPGNSLIDLVSGPTFVPASAGAPLVGSTPEGPGYSSRAANTGATVPGPLPTKFTTWTQFTVRWRGYQAAAPQNFAGYGGVGLDLTSGTYVAAIRFDGAVYAAVWNSGGGASSLTGSAPVAGSFVDLVATFSVNASVFLYLNGVQSATGSFGVSGPNSTATSYIVLNEDAFSPSARFNNGICNITQLWNRQLSAAEVMALYLDPYSLIVGSEYELPSLFTLPGPTLWAQSVM